MLQQVMTAPGQIEFREIPVPVPGPNEILIRVMKIGICGSDIHVYHGKHPFTSYPVTQGHEISGLVEAAGRDAVGFRKGQKVTIQPQVVCGVCYPCRHGKYNLCESLKVMGFQTTGAASEFFAVDASKVTPLPDELPLDEGAMIEPLAVAVHAVRQAGPVKGLKIAVLGAGPIGILVAQAAKAAGAGSVLITDISDVRLAKAKECGIDFTANTAAVDFGEALGYSFGPDRADLIYDCAGNDVSMGQAIRCARKGSRIILVAVFAGPARVDLAVLNDHELDLSTSMMYRHEDYADAIRMASDGRLLLRPLISKEFAFRDYKKAYEYIDANRESTMKVMIRVQE